MKKIKILHLEDNPADAEFIKDILMHEGFNVDVTLTGNRYEFEIAINSGKEYDLVLSDFNLPAFNGFAALKLIKEKMPEVPFILLSGEVSEEQAINVLESGADDYVLKHGMIRLGQSIKRALVEYEKRIEYKKTREHLLLLSRAIEAVSNPVAILITDNHSKIEYINPNFEKVTGYNLAEVEGKNLIDLVPEKLSEDFWKIIRKSIEDKREFQNEFQNVKKNGEVCWEFLKVSPIKNDSEEIVHYLITCEDISFRKKAEKEIIDAKEKAEEMNNLKSAFLSNMSHELRTPLIGIMGYAKMLSNKLINADLREMAEIIIDSGDRLQESLDHIIDLSRIESGLLKINKSNVDLEKVIREVVKQFSKAACIKGLYIRVDIKEKIIVKSDEQVLTQVLNNLVNNAIKYTDEGNITIVIDKVKRDGKKLASVKIIDTGIGIPEENYKRIFEPFRQGSEGLNRKYEGLGLGLAITKKLVDVMDGGLCLESSVTKGSVFSLLIPTADDGIFEMENPNVKQNTSTSETPVEKKYDILIVEDDQTTRDLLKIFVGDICQTTEVSMGEEAVVAAERKVYDAILMDIALKGMNGLEATELIRKIPCYETVPIIAVTAFAMAGDKEKFLDAGCSHYLAKPFIKKAIVKLLHGSIGENRRRNQNPEHFQSKIMIDSGNSIL